MEDKEELLDQFDATNNEAEYEALIAGLRIAEQMGVKEPGMIKSTDLTFCYVRSVDLISRAVLVANQVNGSYIAKEPGMIKYLEK
ncbi:reverse transcriptase domain-containing protein, partial [Tanacetum coccineum]